MNRELTQAFMRMRCQATVSPSDKSVKTEDIPQKKTRSPQRGSKYDLFLQKYESLPESVGKLKTQDLVFFFRQKAEEAGVKYSISNMHRDMGIFKKLKETYTTEEILLMIEFIFSGDQTYLDMCRTQPTVLASNWVNTIYPDSKAWANDEYIDKKTVTTKKTATTNREWKSNKKTNVGEW